MDRRIYLLAAVAVLTASLAAQQPAWPPAPTHLTLPIWPGTVPDALPNPPAETQTTSGSVAGKTATFVTNVSMPTLTLYSPKGKNTGAAVVVFPGGGYNVLAIDYEGAEVCDWLNSMGVTCLVLKYRVPRSGYPRSLAALKDAQRALGIVRSHADEWHIDPKRIGVVGFSAGGHLAAMVSIHFDKRLYPLQDDADVLSCRPDFALLIYPGGLIQEHGDQSLSQAAQPTSETPPTFIVQAEDDPMAPVENSVEYFLALKSAHVPAEMHIYAQGGHGYGLRRTALPVTTWPRTAELWMQTIKILPAP
jgi:acetyl esterase/lipase